MADKKRHWYKNKHLRNDNYFAIIAFVRILFCWQTTLKMDW